MREPVIKAMEINKQFAKKSILSNVSLEVQGGEIIGLLGPSGSGKTTLVKIIVGMLAPNSGEVLVLNTKMPSLEVMSNIGYMAQADALYEDLNAIENLIYFGGLYGWHGRAAKERALEMLQLVGLMDHKDKLISSYSGGMKRRLSLALALYHKPKILILDEPTVGIDPILRQQFWQEFASLRDNGTTIIITTHVMDEADRCDRLALMRDGEIIAIDTPTKLMEVSSANSIEGAFIYFGSGEGEAV
ncbi:MAG: ABC transporter ATP-binding protein [Bacillota bacterium]|nr:ABC transporter ATP-binding protein [Bacillota bacterium]